MSVIRDRIRGMIIGAAVGDALGAPAEFDKDPHVTGYVGGFGRWTDDTQMMVFTARAVDKCLRAFASRQHPDFAREAWQQYEHWYDTMARPNSKVVQVNCETVPLIAAIRMQGERGPGNTCMTSLKDGVPGNLARPLNDSKGAGGVMRAAPVALLRGNADEFLAGCESAALTHGHQDGWMPAGYLARIVADMIDGWTISDSVRESTLYMEGKDKSRVGFALDDAIEVAKRQGRVDDLGEGWVGDEALAIAVYAAARSVEVGTDSAFAHGVLIAVNHPGDSDTTGCIAGAILGAKYGESSIPEIWTFEHLEYYKLLAELADRLYVSYESAQMAR